MWLIVEGGRREGGSISLNEEMENVPAVFKDEKLQEIKWIWTEMSSCPPENVQDISIKINLVLPGKCLVVFLLHGFTHESFQEDRIKHE